jgi:DNA-binding MarR family transcriptional regulator
MAICVPDPTARAERPYVTTPSDPARRPGAVYLAERMIQRAAGNEWHALSARIGIAWTELRRASGMSTLREFLLGSGEDALEQGQMDTLDLLTTRPTWRMSELAERLRVDPSSATRAVQRLVAVGLAERGTQDDDGRVVTVGITAAGRERHSVVVSRRVELMTHMMSAFSRPEREVLADLLERFVAALDDFIEHVTP